MRKLKRGLIVFALVFGLMAPATMFAQTNHNWNKQTMTQEKTEQLSGKLLSVNAQDMTFVVQEANGNKVTFQYNDQTKVTGSDKTIEGLSSQSGTEVTVEYQMHESNRLAKRIEIKQS